MLLYIAQSLPLQFHVYTFMPLMLWWICINRILQKFTLSNIIEVVLQLKGSELMEIFFYLVGIEVLVINFNFTLKNV